MNTRQRAGKLPGSTPGAAAMKMYPAHSPTCCGHERLSKAMGDPITATHPNIAESAEGREQGGKQPPRLLVIIPAYNEEDSLGRVIRHVHQAQPDADIVVINDGSTDATAEIAGGHGVSVVTLPYNLGIGTAMQTGFIFARDRG